MSDGYEVPELGSCWTEPRRKQSRRHKGPPPEPRVVRVTGIGSTDAGDTIVTFRFMHNNAEGKRSVWEPLVGFHNRFRRIQ